MSTIYIETKTRAGLLEAISKVRPHRRDIRFQPMNTTEESGMALNLEGLDAFLPSCTIDGEGWVVRLYNGGLALLGRGTVLRNLQISSGVAVGQDHAGNALRVHAHDCTVEHCTLLWGTNTTVSLFALGSLDPRIYSPRRTVFDRCLIAEGLPPSFHRGMLVGKWCQDIEIRHSLFAHNSERNPAFSHASTGKLTGNVIYNAVDHAMLLRSAAEESSCYVDVVGNRMVAGPNTPAGLPLMRGKIVAADTPGLVRAADNRVPTGFPLDDGEAIYVGAPASVAAYEPYDEVVQSAGPENPSNDTVALRDHVFTGVGSIVDVPPVR